MNRVMKFKLTFIGWYLAFMLLAIIIVIACCSCTEHSKARHWGGEETVNLPKGMKLLEVTWKENNNLWYLLEPMDDDYTPKTKVFKEDSRFGIMEGKVKFIESK